MNYIIDPVSFEKHSIFSSYGKNLLKQYIQYVQTGGMATAQRKQAQQFCSDYNCQKKTIKKCYQSKSLKEHPDKGGDAEIFAKLRNDYTPLENKTSGTCPNPTVKAAEAAEAAEAEPDDEYIPDFRNFMEEYIDLFDSETHPNLQLFSDSVKNKLDGGAKGLRLLSRPRIRFKMSQNDRTFLRNHGEILKTFFESLPNLPNGTRMRPFEVYQQRNNINILEIIRKYVPEFLVEADADAEAEAQRQRRAAEERQRRAAAEEQRRRQQREAAAAAGGGGGGAAAAGDGGAGAEDNCNQISNYLLNLSMLSINKSLTVKQVKKYKDLLNKLINFYKKCWNENKGAAERYEQDIKKEINKYENHPSVKAQKSRGNTSRGNTSRHPGGSAYSRQRRQQEAEAERQQQEAEAERQQQEAEAAEAQRREAAEAQRREAEAQRTAGASAYPESQRRTEDPWGRSKAGASAYPEAQRRTEDPYGRSKARETSNVESEEEEDQSEEDYNVESARDARIRNMRAKGVWGKKDETLEAWLERTLDNKLTEEELRDIAPRLNPNRIKSATRDLQLLRDKFAHMTNEQMVFGGNPQQMQLKIENIKKALKRLAFIAAYQKGF
jgi:hypothetical protein